MASNSQRSFTAGLSAGLGAILCAMIGCAPVDVSNLEPLDGYDQWYRIDSTERVPGHGDTYRIIYANDVARGYTHEYAYPVGSVIVKEIRDNNDGEPGDLRYLGVMRKLTADQVPDGAKLEGGWLFTILDQLGADESQSPTCWENCHVQAPIDGAWLDYGEFPE